MIYLFFDCGALSAAELEKIYRLMPEERRQKYNRYRFEKDKRLCASAYILMLYGIYRQYDLFPAGRDFIYGENMKPSFAEYPDIHFNFSHCDRGIACAVGDEPVGVDIQDIIEYERSFASTVMSPKELCMIENSPDPSLTFTQFWACKESYLKCTGQGIDDNLPECEFTELTSGQFLSHGHHLFLFLQNRCCVCACTETRPDTTICSVQRDDISRFLDMVSMKECPNGQQQQIDFSVN